MESRLVVGIRQQARANALYEFKRARRQAVLEMITSRLRGQSVDLLSYNEIANKLIAQGRSERGLQDIPLSAIVGSVGRYNDFTRSFLPRHDWDAQRWADVKAARPVTEMPPIEVYKVGEAYFVLDGNHRVSIARHLGLEFIQALVIEVHTRVPIAPTIRPDDLIIKAEYAAFLARTQLDILRPFANLHVTIPGQYEKLENHIEVHRFFIEMAGETDLSDNEAVVCWFDEAYMPLVEAIREQDILHEFPGRTETDLYLWLAAHQAQLRNALGWQVRPGTVVSQLSDPFKSKGLASRAYQSVLNVVVPNGWQGQSLKDWTQERMLDRYSQNLFAEILVFISDQTETALQQAIVIAQRENGRVVGLFTGNNDQNASEKEARFRKSCENAEVAAIWVLESGKVTDVVKRRARLADLIVLTHEQINDDLLAHTARPILVAADKVSYLNKALLLSGKNNETSLFAAAYFAEIWKTELVVLADKRQSTIAAYLDFHEVTASFVRSKEVGATAVALQADLILCGRNGRTLETISQSGEIPFLIC